MTEPGNDDFSDLDPMRDSVARINDALTEGARTRECIERAAVHILTTAGCGDLADRAIVRESIHRHPSTRAWVLDWQMFAGRRFQTFLTPAERACVDLACALAADTPVRFFGSNIPCMDARTRANVLHALTIAFGKEETE